MSVTLADVKAARELIIPAIRFTPCWPSATRRWTSCR